MLELVFTIVGMCLCILPFIIIFNYFMTRVSKKTKFDCHINKVKDKKGFIGVVVAYITKILFFFFILLLGTLCVYQFQHDDISKLLLVSFVLYILFYFFDNNNEK